MVRRTNEGEGQGGMDLDQDLIDQMLSGGGSAEAEGDPWSDEQLQAEIDAARLAAGVLSYDEEAPTPAASAAAEHAGTSVATVAASASQAGPTPVHPVQFMPLTPEVPVMDASHGIDLLLDVHLEISVELGRSHMNIRDVLALRSGSLIELDKLAGEPVDVSVNGTLIARGEVVVVDEKFGVRITEVVSKAKRLASLS